MKLINYFFWQEINANDTVKIEYNVYLKLIHYFFWQEINANAINKHDLDWLELFSSETETGDFVPQVEYP